MEVYRNYDLPALEKQYNPETAVPDFGQYLARYATESARVRQSLPARLDAAYGCGPANKLDIFLTDRPAAPIQVFIHGGGWRGSSKNDRAFPAESYCRAGAAWIAMEYPLAPSVTLDEMVRQVRDGLAWIHRNAESFGGDSARIHVTGNSAGGHLAAMLIGTEWRAQYGLPANLIAGATLISGIYDMEPLRLTSANGWLNLDAAAAARNSPIRNLPEHGCPIVVAVGSNETDAFRRQAADYFDTWRERGFPGRLMVLDGHHHFSIIGEVSREGSPLCDAIFEQMGLAGGPA